METWVISVEWLLTNWLVSIAETFTDILKPLLAHAGKLFYFALFWKLENQTLYM